MGLQDGIQKIADDYIGKNRKKSIEIFGS